MTEFALPPSSFPLSWPRHAALEGMQTAGRPHS
jgi:hypothetical protein